MGPLVTHEKIICFYVRTELRASVGSIARLFVDVCVETCMSVADLQLEGFCVGRSILCRCKLISRIQTQGAPRRKEPCASATLFMKGGKMLYGLLVSLCVMCVNASVSKRGSQNRKIHTRGAVTQEI